MNHLFKIKKWATLKRQYGTDAAGDICNTSQDFHEYFTKEMRHLCGKGVQSNEMEVGEFDIYPWMCELVVPFAD
jgi:hypothetical protein